VRKRQDSWSQFTPPRPESCPWALRQTSLTVLGTSQSEESAPLCSQVALLGMPGALYLCWLQQSSVYMPDAAYDSRLRSPCHGQELCPFVT